MALNPGADSNGKNVDKVPAPINVPAVSLETKSVPLPETKVAVVYSCTRALQNHAYSYLPLFLIYRLRLGKRCFTIASPLVVCSGVMSYFITQSITAMIYPAAVILGLGLSSMLLCSLSFATELIGENKKKSGLIFGFMTLMSYVIGEPLILIAQQLFPKRSGTDCAECGNYLRLVFSFVAIALSTASSLIVSLLHCIDGLREKSSSTSKDSESSSSSEQS
ncbi:major facilitator superfamily domain-containing protein 12-like [Montipora foliosa]|uniref:major facilitator superfamily domain-containing protein 12-like n=1 Tax=Montipora foliosa TaxID=591990 RepID=UPI0035F11BFF